MNSDTTLNLLAAGRFTLTGQFVRGSNYTFLGELDSVDGPVKVVYKPTRGEIPLWDFPPGTLGKREVAAYLMSRFLGWDLVPPTLYRKKVLPLGPGMLQVFIEHNPQYHYFNFTDTDKNRLQVVAVFDLLINNADRKGSHVLIGTDNHLWCIDHGVSFHVDDKLRTVIWDFAGQALPDGILADLEGFLSRSEGVHQTLKSCLRKSEINALLRRTQLLLKEKTFSLPTADRRMYPYPPV